MTSAWWRRVAAAKHFTKLSACVARGAHGRHVAAVAIPQKIMAAREGSWQILVARTFHGWADR